MLLESYLELVERGFFEKPRKRSFLEHFFREAERWFSNGQPILLIAPPGIGKTSVVYTSFFSMLNQGHRAAWYRVAHILPLRSIIERSFDDFLSGMLRLGFEKEILENLAAKQMSLHMGAPFFQRKVIFTTFDSFSLMLCKIPIAEVDQIIRWQEERGFEYFGHYELPRASMLVSLPVLDEVHLAFECERALKTIASITRFFASYKTPLVLMSATIPKPYVESLVDFLKRRLCITPRVVNYSEFVRKHGFEEFYREESVKKFDNSPPRRLSDFVKGVVNIVKELSGKIAIVVNTVRRAYEVYRSLGTSKKLLIHARFTPKDKERKLDELFKMQAGVLVATQVIEAGINASFDAMVSEAAPLTSLIQRFGRLARGDVSEGAAKVVYDDKTLSSDVYEKAEVEITLKILSNRLAKDRNLNWHLPIPEAFGYEKLLNEFANYIPLKVREDLNIWQLLVNPHLSAEEALRYLLRVRSFIREESLATVYLGYDIPSAYSEFVDRLADKSISIGLENLQILINEIGEMGETPYLVKRDWKGNVFAEEASKIAWDRLQRDIMFGKVVAVAIPEYLYSSEEGLVI